MQMQITLPESHPDAGYTIRPEYTMSDREFFEFCSENSDLRIEREANGEIVIMPPSGLETSYQNNNLAILLGIWARQDGRGRSFDSNGGYTLPDGSMYSPDASWVLKERLRQVTRQELARFPRLCPDFVVELTSPSDRLAKVMAKMRNWMKNGVTLGWLLDARNRDVYIYRPGAEPERLVGVDFVDGEGPIAGFHLNLSEVWEDVVD
jgi:Uma2 family endonuclease